MTDSSPSAAVIGVGVMGGAIAARLLETGANVAAFDLDSAKLRPLAEKGARPAASPADATRGAAFVPSAGREPRGHARAVGILRRADFPRRLRA